MGRGVFWGGEPRHCICTNASHGLSAIAEFLIYYSKLPLTSPIERCYITLRRNMTHVFVCVIMYAAYMYLLKGNRVCTPAVCALCGRRKHSEIRHYRRYSYGHPKLQLYPHNRSIFDEFSPTS